MTAGGRDEGASAPEPRCAYLFEAKGIQRYVFDSGPLRDLVGASDLVAALATSRRPASPDDEDLIGRVIAALGIRDAGVTFSRRAGGAFCLHAERASCEAIRALWRLVVSLTCPGLEYSDAIATGASDVGALREAYKSLGALRFNAGAELPPTGNPVTDFSRRTGRVVTRLYAYGPRDAEEIVTVDVVTEAQRRRSQALQRDPQRDSVARRFLGAHTSGPRVVFPRNLEPDEEGGDPANPSFPFVGDDRRVAVIHADLSGLGEIFQSVSDRAVRADEILQVATAIEAAIEAAAQTATRAVLLYGDATNTSNAKTFVAPARPVLLGGDDITIVVRADLAVPFAKELLAAIEAQTKAAFERLGDSAALPCDRLSACAGIAIINAGQPFLMANALAEDLCKFAKGTAKHGGTVPYPSLLAFHVGQSTLQENYDAIRARELTIGSSEDPVTLSASPFAVGDRKVDGAVPFDALAALATALSGTAARGRGKLIEAAQALFDDPRVAEELWARWGEVLDDDGGEAVEAVWQALMVCGISKGSRFTKVVGVLSDALELVDLGATEAPGWPREATHMGSAA